MYLFFSFKVLTSFKIMDYSLLVGIHNLDLAARKKAVSIFFSISHYTATLLLLMFRVMMVLVLVATIWISLVA